MVLVDTLITYLPFYRIHEVLEYFVRNADALGVRHRVVYVDNVFRDKQVELLRRIIPEDVDLRTINYRDRNLTFIRIIRDSINEGWDALVVDSDNLLEPDLTKVDGDLVAKYGFYTVLDHETTGKYLFLRRSEKLGVINVDGRAIDVYGYRVAGSWKGVFFIGPKQAVRLSRSLLESLNMDAVNKVEDALKDVEPSLRLFISDETTLGMILYHSGVKVMPWVIMTHHMHHGSTTPKDLRMLKLLVATAHAQLGRNLLKYGLINNRTIWYYTRYKIAQLYNFTINFIFK